MVEKSLEGSNDPWRKGHHIWFCRLYTAQLWEVPFTGYDATTYPKTQKPGCNRILLIIKKTEVMPFAATWMDLESVTLSEESHTKEKYRTASLICGI